MTSLAKWQVEEKVRVALLKTRGNVIAAADQTGIDLEYVKKVAAKFKKSQARDVNLYIASNLMEHIFFGHQSRVQHLMDMMQSLYGRHQLDVSMCCSMPVVEHHDSNGEVLLCGKCGKETSARMIDRTGIFELHLKIIDALRVEDEALTKFAEKMGYTNRPPEQPQPKVNLNQQFLVLGKGGQELSEDDKLRLQEIKNMDPMDRERLRKRLLREIAEEEKKADEPEHQD